MVYSKGGLKVETSSKTADTMNGTILVAAANQKPASSCTFEIYYVTKSTAGSAIITKAQAVHYVGLQQNRDSNMPHCSSYGCSNNIGKYGITALSLLLPFESTKELKQWFSGRYLLISILPTTCLTLWFYTLFDQI